MAREILTQEFRGRDGRVPARMHAGEARQRPQDRVGRGPDEARKGETGGRSVSSDHHTMLARLVPASRDVAQDLAAIDDHVAWLELRRMPAAIRSVDLEPIVARRRHHGHHGGVAMRSGTIEARKLGVRNRRVVDDAQDGVTVLVPTEKVPTHQLLHVRLVSRPILQQGSNNQEAEIREIAHDHREDATKIVIDIDPRPKMPRILAEHRVGLGCRREGEHALLLRKPTFIALAAHRHIAGLTAERRTMKLHEPPLGQVKQGLRERGRPAHASRGYDRVRQSDEADSRKGADDRAVERLPVE